MKIVTRSYCLEKGREAKVPLFGLSVLGVFGEGGMFSISAHLWGWDEKYRMLDKTMDHTSMLTRKWKGVQDAYACARACVGREVEPGQQCARP